MKSNYFDIRTKKFLDYTQEQDLLKEQECKKLNIHLIVIKDFNKQR